MGYGSRDISAGVIVTFLKISRDKVSNSYSDFFTDYN